MSLTLHSFEGDFRAFKAQIAAEYNGVKVANATVASGAALPADLAAKSPLGKVPVLDTPHGAIFESNAIARYIARLRRDTELYGATFFESSQVDSWLDFASHDVEAAVDMWLNPVLGTAEYNEEMYKGAVAGVGRALTVLNKYLEANTFLVGEQVSLADIVLVSVLFYPFKFLFDGAFRAGFPHVTRWFITCVNQPQFKAVLGPVSLAASEMKSAGASEGVSAVALVGKPAAAAGAGGAGAGKKGGDKKAEKKEKKEKAPKAAAPAPAPAPAPPAAAAAEDYEDEDEKPKPKVKGPFDDLPPSKMNMDHWKRTYSNSRSDYYLSMKPFWEEIFDKEGYSIWTCKYKYNEENKVDYMTSNLVGGFLQRCDEVRRYAFGSMVILNETAPFEIEGCWLIRGHSIAPLLEANPDAEYYEWTMMNTEEPATRALIADYWCSMGNINGKAQYDSKIFK